MTSFELLKWVPVGGCVLAALVIAGAMGAMAWAERKQLPVPHWSPSGPWYPPTPRLDEPGPPPRVLLPAAVERELAILAAMIPDRPA